MMSTAALSPTYPTIPHMPSAFLLGCGRAGSTPRGPPLLRHLRASLDGERIRRHILRDHRARADVGALADGQRGHHADVGSDERPVPDLGLGLREAVVVARDRAGADVHAVADGRIADVRQVVGLAAPSNARLLDLD